MTIKTRNAARLPLLCIIIVMFIIVVFVKIVCQYETRLRFLPYVGSRAISVFGPSAWNDLPLPL